MPRTRPPFPAEFRREAVRLVYSSGKRPAEIAAELGCSEQTLRQWLKQERIDSGEASESDPPTSLHPLQRSRSRRSRDAHPVRTRALLSPFVDEIERERGGTHDNDGFVLSAQPGKSQGRPRTTSSSQLIGQIGLPVRVSQQRPMSRKHECSRRRRTGVSCPDNAFAYVNNRSLRELLAREGIRHLRTKPYRPRTNGKVERFHQTMAREWAYGVVYRSHRQRNQAATLARALQPAQTTQLARRPAPDQPRSQRPWVGQLGPGAPPHCRSLIVIRARSCLLRSRNEIVGRVAADDEVEVRRRSRQAAPPEALDVEEPLRPLLVHSHTISKQVQECHCRFLLPMMGVRP
jgi:transposase-like protein